jgi:hypothetical protein
MPTGSGSLAFRQITVPDAIVRGYHAVSQAVVEDGQSAEEVGNLLLLLGNLLSFRVPLSDSLPATRLLRQPLLRLQNQLQNARSDLELRMLVILTDAGVAEHFATGCQIAVQYPDRCSDDEVGVAKPDFYYRRAKLAIFCDSDQFHSSPEARARDNGVTSALQHRGIRVLRFTGAQISRAPVAVGRTILAHLAISRLSPASKGGRHAA